jgi:MFS family permease
LVLLLGLAGAAGASVNSASGRAVMQWFPAHERGLALGVRQTAIPLGGLIAAVVLPMLGLRTAFFFLAALCFAGAIFGSVVIRDREAAADLLEAHGLGETLRDRRLVLLCLGAASTSWRRSRSQGSSSCSCTTSAGSRPGRRRPCSPA